MVEKRNLPDLWVRICGRVGLPKEASIERVMAAYGDSVGRGTIQRIRDGGDPRLASLKKMADHIRVDVRELVGSIEHSAPPPPPSFAPAPLPAATMDPNIAYGNEHLSQKQVEAILADLRTLLPEDRLEWIQNLHRQAEHNRKVLAHASRNRVTGKSAAASNVMTARIALPPRIAGDGNPAQGSLDGVNSE